MQKLHLPARPIFRAPMLDLTNQQNSFEALKLPNVSMTTRAYTTLDSFEAPMCPHYNKIKASSCKYSNCVDCGAYISNDGLSTLREENKKCNLEISPSILIENMIKKQHFNRNLTSELGSPEIMVRKKIVDWLCEIGESFHISSEFIHKAICYLDVIMAENTIADNDMQPLGVVCLLVACKMGEKDRQVDEIKAFLQSKLNIPAGHIRKYEMQVLSLLNFDLQCVTPMDFLQIFLFQGVIFKNEHLTNGKITHQKLAITIRQYAEFFADMVLQEYKMTWTINSQHLACGIILAARKMLKLEKGWNNELTIMTGLKYEEIYEIAEEILKIYSKLFGKTGPIMKKEDKENIIPKTSRIAVGQNSRNNSNLPYSAIRYV